MPPAFVLNGDRTSKTPAGPKLASLEVNLKCELMRTVQDNDPLTDYVDGIDPRTNNVAFQPQVDGAERFSLANYFRQIEYVAEVQLTLDVTGNAGVNPGLTYTDPMRAAIPSKMLPQSSFTLGVSGQYSDTGHRNIVLYQSVDTDRLLKGPGSAETIRIRRTDDGKMTEEEWTACAGNAERPAGEFANSNRFSAAGTDLQGDLGLHEAIATALEGLAMTDINVFPPHPAASDTPAKPAQKPDDVVLKAKNWNEVLANLQAYLKAPPADAPAANPVDGTISKLLAGNTDYQFGQFSTQIDFTITEAAGIGPNWSLAYFKGPGGGSGASGPGNLFSTQRTVKDTLQITMVPVCIRDEYSDVLGLKRKAQPPALPKVMHGTPHWANFLPPCNTADHGGHRGLLLKGLSSAHLTNQTATILLRSNLSQ